MVETTKQGGPPRPVKRATTPAPTPPPTKPAPAKSSGGYLGKSPLAGIIFGQPGVGKTEFAGHFPGAGFIQDSQETGASDLLEFGKIPEPVVNETFDNFEAVIDYTAKIAIKPPPGLQTLIYDSLTGFEKLCFVYHCREFFEDDWTKQGFYSYQQGPKNAAKTDWPRFLDTLDLVRAAGINILLVAHSQVKNFINPEGPDYDRFSPYLDKETWAQTHRWAKMVLFYNYHVDMMEKKGPRQKADQSSSKRFIYTEWAPAYDAKNRYGLEPLIDAGGSGEEAYHNFEEDFKRAIKVANAKKK